MSVENWWNVTDRGKQEYLDVNRSHCYFVNHKRHMDIPVVQPGPPLWHGDNKTPEAWHGIQNQTTIIDRSISYRAVNTFRLSYQESMLVYVKFLVDGVAVGQVVL